jgi:hypothetical protein
MITKSLQCFRHFIYSADTIKPFFPFLFYLIRAAILICNALLGVGGVIHGLSGASRLVQVYK